MLKERKNNFGMSLKMLETFTDNWRRITYSYPDIHNTCYYDGKNNKIKFNSSIDFNFTKQQKKLLETYSEYIGSYDYYNLYRRNEFAHILIFKNPNITSGKNKDAYFKYLFFIFRSKLKIRSKV